MEHNVLSPATTCDPNALGDLERASALLEHTLKEDPNVWLAIEIACMKGIGIKSLTDGASQITEKLVTRKAAKAM